MSKNYYKLYINSTLDLAETLVIKSEESALAINNYLILTNGSASVDPYDQTSWKYYKNICGEYHSTDELIYVTSLDTLEKIAFTKENLTIHRATSNAYQYGLRHYTELLSIYPDKEQLILGILYPADLNKAISSDDGVIISYPSNLVEHNEYSLIENLNKWIKNYKIRWHNVQFGITDNLYPVSHLGLLYLNIVPTILNLRLAACKTNEVHSFHVRQYLASHGMLDLYLDQMSNKQALFFYRNISYIERNSGKREIFQWLVEHIMTERGLPLAEFTMKHNEGIMPKSLYPEITFKKKLVNIGYNVEEKNRYTLEELLNKEQPLEVGNKDYRIEHQYGIQEQFENSLSSVVATKMLESSVIDYTDATPYTFQDIVLNHWLYLSSINYYNSFLSFKNPRTGETYTLNASDAFIYMMYAFAKAIGSNINIVPSFIALRVQRLPTPDIDTVMKVVDSNYVSRDLVSALIANQALVRPALSVESFYNQAREIFNSAQRGLGFESNQEHEYSRGIVHNVINHLYSDNTIHYPAEGMNYIDWINSKHLPIVNFTPNEYMALYQDIFQNATGSNLSTTMSIGNIQKAMLKILTQLSSYSIQLVSDLNTSSIKVLNWAVIRLGDITKLSLANPQLPDTRVGVMIADAATHDKNDVAANYPVFALTEKVRQGNIFEINNTVDVLAPQSVAPKQVIKIPFNSPFLSAMCSNEDPSVYFKTAFIGYDNYLVLHPNDKNDLKDVYSNNFESFKIVKLDIKDYILTDELKTYSYFGVDSPKINGFKHVNLNGSTNIFVGTVFNKPTNSFVTMKDSLNTDGFTVPIVVARADEFGLYTYPDYVMPDYFQEF